MNSIYHTNKLKKKTHITSSTDEAKASDSIQHWFWTNTQNTGNRGKLGELNMHIRKKSLQITLYLMVKASAFPSKSEQSEMSVLILLIQHSIRSSI